MSSLLVDDDEIESGEQSENSHRSQPVLPPEKPPKKPRSQKLDKTEGRTPSEQSPLPDRSPEQNSLEVDPISWQLASLSVRIERLEAKEIQGLIALTPTERTVLARVAKSFTLQYRTKNPDWVAELLTLLKPLGIEEEYQKLMVKVEIKDQKKKLKKTRES